MKEEMTPEKLHAQLDVMIERTGHLAALGMGGGANDVWNFTNVSKEEPSAALMFMIFDLYKQERAKCAATEAP